MKRREKLLAIGLGLFIVLTLLMYPATVLPSLQSSEPPASFSSKATVSSGGSAQNTPLAETSDCGLTTLQVLIPGNISNVARGENYTDPIFGCVVKRLSDANREGSDSITHLYSSVNPFNADSTLVLLQKSNGELHIRDLNGNIVKDKLYEFGILPLSDPVWSRSDPGILYFHHIDQPELKWSTT